MHNSLSQWRTQKLFLGGRTRGGGKEGVTNLKVLYWKVGGQNNITLKFEKGGGA